ncbi:MAG: hypothetical protein HFI26_15475 [Lachnospiraceae bacterium]|nr:hypothetical protein [Lachnospiraceae bacterium]
MKKDKLTVRKVIKNVVKTTGDSGSVSVECKGIMVYFDFYVIEEGKCCIFYTKGFKDFANKILELEVDKYEVESSTFENIIEGRKAYVEIKIKTTSFAERYVL